MSKRQEVSLEKQITVCLKKSDIETETEKISKSSDF